MTQLRHQALSLETTRRRNAATAKRRHSTARQPQVLHLGCNIAVQRGPDLMLANAVCCAPNWGPQMYFHRAKRREFIALLAHRVVSSGGRLALCWR